MSRRSQSSPHALGPVFGKSSLVLGSLLKNFGSLSCTFYELFPLLVWGISILGASQGEAVPMLSVGLIVSHEEVKRAVGYLDL